MYKIVLIKGALRSCSSFLILFKYFVVLKNNYRDIFLLSNFRGIFASKLNVNTNLFNNGT